MIGTISDTIAEYRRSYSLLRGGAAALGARIDAIRRTGGFPAKSLLDRRRRLYAQMDELKYSIKALQEYTAVVRK